MRESELRKEVVAALNSLKSREQQVMQLRYGLDGKPPLSRHEVSDLLGVTTQTIRTDEVCNSVCWELSLCFDVQEL
jgi:DNA-directed RNA polymerase sigma subunit (sigma70/sigma32)